MSLTYAVEGTLETVNTLRDKVVIDGKTYRFMDPRYWDSGAAYRAHKGLLGLRKLVGRRVTAHVENHATFGPTIFGRAQIKLARSQRKKNPKRRRSSGLKTAGVFAAGAATMHALHATGVMKNPGKLRVSAVPNGAMSYKFLVSGTVGRIAVKGTSLVYYKELYRHSPMVEADQITRVFRADGGGAVPSATRRKVVEAVAAEIRKMEGYR